METKPDAPGLKWRTRRSGDRVPVWIARPDAVAAGYPVKTANLKHLVGNDAAIAARCQRLHSEMLLWLQQRGHRPERAFDGTLGALLDIYETHPESTFRSLSASSRHPYSVYLKRLRGMIGARRIPAVDGLDVVRWHKTWREPDHEGAKEKLAGARMALTVLKSALTFGAMLRLEGCMALREIIALAELPAPRPRKHAPTAEQIDAARRAAHAIGRPSLALAYALQFETVLRQWDVIGRWVELAEPATSGVLGYGRKWVGLSWSHVDRDLILTLTPHKTEDSSGATVVVDLKLCPMVLEELPHVPADKHAGPMIVDERTGLPYYGANFRVYWRREVAPRAGLPVAMWNRDIRAGGITEGTRSGADRTDASKMAGHTKPATTVVVYDRDVLEASRRVQRKRLAARNTPGT